MTSDDNKNEVYKTLAELIYAGNPDSKELLNQCAQMAIDAIRSTVSVELPDDDVESILAIVAAFAADILTTPVNNISEKVNRIFDIHSLAAGAVIGQIDLGDVSMAKDMATLMREATEQAERHADGSVDGTGLYL